MCSHIKCNFLLLFHKNGYNFAKRNRINLQMVSIDLALNNMSQIITPLDFLKKLELHPPELTYPLLSPNIVKELFVLGRTHQVSPFKPSKILFCRLRDRFSKNDKIDFLKILTFYSIN